MADRTLAIAVEIPFPSRTIRLWDGAGSMLAGGFVWRGGGLFTGLDEIEMAMNGESAGFSVSLSNVSSDAARAAYQDYLADKLIGTPFIVHIQPRDQYHQPLGDMRVEFTGTIADFSVTERVDRGERGDVVTATISIEVINRMEFRNLPSGSVLSNADQQLEHPGDLGFERVPGLINKSISWPNYPNN